MTWYRVGNTADLFPKEHLWQAYYRIQYRPLVRSKIIRCLHIERLTNQQVNVLVEGTGFGDVNLNEVLQQYYPQLSVNKFHVLGWVPFKLNTDEDVQLFFKFLLAVNKKEGFELFEKNLLDEFKNVITYIWENKTYQSGLEHLISEKSGFHPNNVRNNTSRSKLRLLMDKEKYSLSEFKKILSKGEDPNQCDSYYGHLPIETAILMDQLEALELLIIYGANVHLRAGETYCSGYEFALCYEKIQCLKLIGASQTQPEKSSSLTKIQRQSSHMLGSIFELESGEKIHTYCKKTSNMAKWEWIELLKLYKLYFKTEDESKLETELLKEIIDDDKYIDFIFAGDRLIGFNIYQIAYLKNFPNIVTVYSLYTLMHDDYQHTRLAPILDFRFGYAVQCLFPSKMIVFFGLLVSDDAYGMVEKIGIHFPKYIYKGAKQFVKQLLEVIEPDLADKYKHNNIGNWIQEKVSLQNKTSEALSFFYKHILNYGNGPIAESRSAPCFFMLSGETLSALNGLSVRLGICLSQVIIDMVRVLERLQKPENLARYSYPFSHGQQMFWVGVRVDDRQSKGVESIAQKCEKGLKPKLAMY